jgi:predicted TIM-barrel fold metal-dependent hydrolase
MSISHTNGYLERFLRGIGLQGVFIVDSHVHNGHWAVMHIPRPDFQDTLRTMDRLGIHASVVNGILHPDYKEGNDKVAELIKQHPGRVIGAVAANPFYRQDITAELHRCFDQLGFTGIKIHENLMKQSFSYSYHPSLLEPILEFAQERGCPILYHGLISEAMIRDHPRVNFICAHGPANVDLCVDLAKYENFHVDTAYTITLPGTWEFLVSNLGAHRILFGSDAPLSSPVIRLAQVLAARISDDAVIQMLGLNAARLYGLQISQAIPQEFGAKGGKL